MSVTKHYEDVTYVTARLTNDRNGHGWHIVRVDHERALCGVTPMSGQAWKAIEPENAKLPPCGKCAHMAENKGITPQKTAGPPP